MTSQNFKLFLQGTINLANQISFEIALFLATYFEFDNLNVFLVDSTKD